MGKKYSFVILLLVMGLIFVGCNHKGTGEEEGKGESYFNGTVVEMQNNSVLVEPFKGEEILNSADCISVPKEVLSTQRVPDMQVGSYIRVVYNGEVLESYPAQLGTVFSIYPIDKEGNIIEEPMKEPTQKPTLKPTEQPAKESTATKALGRDLNAIKKYLSSFPSEIEQLEKMECYIPLYGGEESGRGHLEAFTEAISINKPTQLLTVKFTTEGDPILYYLDYDGKNFFLVTDSTRDKFGSGAIKVKEYSYGKFLKGTLENGDHYKVMFLMEKEELTEKQLEDYLNQPNPKKEINVDIFFNSIVGNSNAELTGEESWPDLATEYDESKVLINRDEVSYIIILNGVTGEEKKITNQEMIQDIMDQYVKLDIQPKDSLEGRMGYTYRIKLYDKSD